jgi:hypothetical protein
MLLPDWLVDGDELGAVGEGGLDLHLMEAGGADDMRARLH